MNAVRKDHYDLTNRVDRAGRCSSGITRRADRELMLMGMVRFTHCPLVHLSFWKLDQPLSGGSGVFFWMLLQQSHAVIC